MSRKRVKFTQYSLDRFLNYGQYNESLKVYEEIHEEMLRIWDVEF